MNDKSLSNPIVPALFLGIKGDRKITNEQHGATDQRYKVSDHSLGQSEFFEIFTDQTVAESEFSRAALKSRLENPEIKKLEKHGNY